MMIITYMDDFLSVGPYGDELDIEKLRIKQSTYDPCLLHTASNDSGFGIIGVGILGSPASSAGNRLSHLPGSADPLWTALVNIAYPSSSPIL